MGMGLLDAPPRSNGHNQQQFNLLLEEGILINPWLATATGRRRIPKYILTFCRCWFQFQKTTVFKIQIHLPYTFEFFFVETVWSNHYMLPLDPQACGSQWWHFWSDRNSVHWKKNWVPLSCWGELFVFGRDSLVFSIDPPKKTLENFANSTVGESLGGRIHFRPRLRFTATMQPGNGTRPGPSKWPWAFGAAKNSGGSGWFFLMWRERCLFWCVWVLILCCASTKTTSLQCFVPWVALCLMKLAINFTKYNSVTSSFFFAIQSPTLVISITT